MNPIRFSTCLLVSTGLAMGLWGTEISWAKRMKLSEPAPFATNKKTEAFSEGLQPTVHLDRQVHFFTPQGEDISLPSGNYHIEMAESWLKLLPEGEAPSSMILLEAIKGNHGEQLAETTVRVAPDESNPDIFYLAILLPDGTGLETSGSYSGIRTRRSRLAILKRSKSKTTRRLAPQSLRLTKKDPEVEREIIRLQRLMRQGPQAVPDKQTSLSTQSQQSEQAIVENLLELRKLLGK